MSTFLSWFFLIISPIIGLYSAYVVYKKRGNKSISTIVLSILTFSIVSFLLWYISAFIGINYY